MIIMDSLVNLAYKKIIPIAVKENNSDVILFILETFYNINMFNDLLLEWSSRNGHYDIIKLLIKKCIDKKLNFRIKDDIVFKFCVRFGYVDLVKILLDNGVCIHIDNNYVLRWAIFNDDSDMIELIKNYKN